MIEMQELLSKRWILKSEDSAMYYKIKDNIKEIRKLAQDHFGYIVVVNSNMIKLEKIPGKSEAWMGIQEFKDVKEYQLFCTVLMYLNDKDAEYKFVLSSLSEYIQLNFEGDKIDWTQFSLRRQLIRVMKYCISMNLLIHHDGQEDLFAKDLEADVLYENTGLSRYYMRNFTTNIMEYETPTDFNKHDWIDVNEDRGLVRRHRIYRRLLLSCGLYREEKDEDFAYIRNYRNQIQRDFQSMFECSLHTHRTSSYLIADEETNIGRTFPSRNAMSDLILIFNSHMVSKINTGNYMLDMMERLTISTQELVSELDEIINKHYDVLPKKMRDDGVSSTIKQVIHQMTLNGFIKAYEDMYIIYPIIAKLTGGYHYVNK